MSLEYLKYHGCIKYVAEKLGVTRYQAEKHLRYGTDRAIQFMNEFIEQYNDRQTKIRYKNKTYRKLREKSKLIKRD